VSHACERSSAAPLPSVAAAQLGLGAQLREAATRLAARGRRPELLGLVALSGVLNLWALSRNGWANTFYSAAVRSMSSSWHDFLYASLDKGGVMTVDKPPLALWVQALSARVFGYHQLSLLLPQALIGIASVALVYDLVRRRFGRAGGFAAGLALALTPIAVGVSRHNNPDALLVLCCVGAVWCAARAVEGGRTSRLVLAGVCVGLGFETKLLVALVVVPGIVLAWLWLAPAGRGRLHALRQLLAAGTAMVLVGGAWPALVELTPASERPWISGTSDNRVLSLIFEYNGLGRVDGQAGGPASAGGNMFGGSAGPLRLLNSALGGQAGWLLGFALVCGVALLVSTRLRRGDRRSGWLLVVGGAFLTTAALFSFASGIFHPYYVSLLAPFTAALAGAGFAQLLAGRADARLASSAAVVLGAVVELVVRSRYPGQLGWLPAVLIPVTALAAAVLLFGRARLARSIALAASLGALLLAPTAWAFDTLGYAANGTFPSGGPRSALTAGAGPGGFAGRPRAGSAPGSFIARPGGSGGPQPLFAGPAGGPPGNSNGGPAGPQGLSAGAPSPPLRGTSGSMRRGFAGGPGFGSESLKPVLSYTRSHGGGVVAVVSQSNAASAMMAGEDEVAGIGGFSGRESDVSTTWLAQEVRAGKIRWVLDDGSVRALGRGLPGDTRTGPRTAMGAVAAECRQVRVLMSASGSRAQGTLYDCAGRAAALASWRS
jgi:4-amino-4-deoxy-L-arabinose transferase-like glycosyltransferase